MDFRTKLTKTLNVTTQASTHPIHLCKQGPEYGRERPDVVTFNVLIFFDKAADWCVDTTDFCFFFSWGIKDWGYRDFTGWIWDSKLGKKNRAKTGEYEESKDLGFKFGWISERGKKTQKFFRKGKRSGRRILHQSSPVIIKQRSSQTETKTEEQEESSDLGFSFDVFPEEEENPEFFRNRMRSGRRILHQSSPVIKKTERFFEEENRVKTGEQEESKDLGFNFEGFPKEEKNPERFSKGDEIWMENPP